MSEENPDNRYGVEPSHSEETQKRVQDIALAALDKGKSVEECIDVFFDALSDEDSTRRVLRCLTPEEQWDLYDKVDFLFNCAQIKDQKEWDLSEKNTVD